MTRFEQEINGLLGQWWQDRAKKEVARAVEKATEDAIVEEDGAIKWKSNGQYLMDDFCEKLEYAGYNFSREATKLARSNQSSKFLAEYRKNYKGPSTEELSEMRLAFGRGSKVVDVITGETIQL